MSEGYLCSKVDMPVMKFPVNELSVVSMSSSTSRSIVFEVPSPMYMPYITSHGAHLRVSISGLAMYSLQKSACVLNSGFSGTSPAT